MRTWGWRPGRGRCCRAISSTSDRSKASSIPCFEWVRSRAAGVAPDGLMDLVAFEIKVIVVHGSEDLLAGAVRRFDLVRQQDRLLVRGHEVGTRQIRFRRKRKKLRDDLIADL